MRGEREGSRCLCEIGVLTLFQARPRLSEAEQPGMWRDYTSHHARPRGAAAILPFSLTVELGRLPVPRRRYEPPQRRLGWRQRASSASAGPVSAAPTPPPRSPPAPLRGAVGAGAELP